MLGGPHPGDFETQAQVHAERVEVDLEGRALGLAEQDRLGQRRPVVGLVGFGTDEGDGSGEALFAQGHRGLHAGHARADDDHVPRFGLRLLFAHPITISS